MAATPETLSKVHEWLTRVTSDLADLPEEEEANYAISRHQRRRAHTTSDRLPSSSRSKPPPPELGTTGRQLGPEDMDMDLVFETLPDLDSYAQKLLDLLIVNPSSEDLLRSVRLPGSRVSKRLSVYERSFEASKTAFGASHYLPVNTFELALGNSILTPLLYKANLAVLADFIYTALETSDSTFQELKEIERRFPEQVGGVINEGNLDLALDLRTQTMIRGMMTVGGDALDPDFFLRHFFIQETTPGGLGDTGYKFKPWPGQSDVSQWAGHFIERIKAIRGTFYPSRGQESEDGPEEEPVDFDELTQLYPWEDFVRRMADFIKNQAGIIERSMNGTRVEDLVSAAKKANGDSVASSAAMPTIDERHAPIESIAEAYLSTTVKALDQGPSGTSTEVDEVEYQPLPHSVEQVSGGGSIEPFPSAPSQVFLSGESQWVPSFALIITCSGWYTLSRRSQDCLLTNQPICGRLDPRPFKRLKKQLEQERRASAEPPLALSGEQAVGRAAARAKVLKESKRSSGALQSPEVAGGREASDAVPSVVSDKVITNLAQMKTFKSRKSEIQKLHQVASPPLPLSPSPHPSAQRDQQPEVQENTVEGMNENETEADPEQDTDGTPVGYLAWTAIRTERDKENQAGALVPPASASRGTKRKRFVDPQVGATRASPIDEDGDVISTPLHSKSIDKGKRRRIRSPSVYEEDEDEPEDEDEDEDVFAQDQREADVERIRRSRRNIPVAPVHGSNSTSAEGSHSPQLKRAPLFKPRSSGASESRESFDRSGAGLATGDVGRRSGSQRSETQDPEPTSSMRRVNKEDIELMTETERVNKLAKINRMMTSRHERQPRKLWDDESTEKLIEVIEEVGPRWAVIRDVRTPEFGPF